MTATFYPVRTCVAAFTFPNVPLPKVLPEIYKLMMYLEHKRLLFLYVRDQVIMQLIDVQGVMRTPLLLANLVNIIIFYN